MLASLPPLWVGQAMLMLGISAGMGLMKLAYALGRDGRVGLLTLECVRKFQGNEAVLEQARLWSRAGTCPTVAAFAGIVESALLGRPEQAARWHAEALATGRDDPYGNLDMLGLLLAGRESGERQEAAAREVVRQGRSSGPAAKLALTVLMYRDLEAGRLEEARETARRVLSIEKYIPATIVLWAVAAARGEAARADALRRELEAAPWSQKLQFWVAANRAIGREEEARRALAEHAPAGEGGAA